jgi:hypothetical protein
MTSRYDILSGRTDKDGKKRWTKIGSMWPSKQGEGFSIKLEALPLPNAEGEVWISAFVPRENDGGAPARVPANRGTPIALDDDIPF